MTSSAAAVEAPTWVLLEGASDVAAVRALRAARGVSPEDEPCLLVDMGGATNIRRHLEVARTARPRPRVVGLCDEREAAYFVRALAEVRGVWAAGGDPEADLRRPMSLADLPDHGFHVCRRDLEDELLRALGVDGALAVLTDLGLHDAFVVFTRQPAWHGRPELDQLRRFCGTTSGRKELLAGALAGALGDADCPPPLAALLDSLPSG